MTHIYIPKLSDMWCIHHYGSTEVNMHLDFLGPLNIYCVKPRSAKFYAKNGHNKGLKLLNFESFRGLRPWTPGRGLKAAPGPHPHKASC